MDFKQEFGAPDGVVRGFAEGEPHSVASAVDDIERLLGGGVDEVALRGTISAPSADFPRRSLLAMFEFHGWVTVCDSADDGDEDAARRAVGLIEERIIESRMGPGVVDLRWVNGEAQLHLGGFTNHRAARSDDAVALFAYIGEVAPGSYGLLHARDDEDPEHRNAFRVGVLRRGTVTWTTDTYLSPIVPTIEDP